MVQLRSPQSNLGKGLFYSCLILIVNFIVVAAASFAQGRNLFSYVTLLTLLEAGLLLFTGRFKPPSIVPVKALQPEVRIDWSLTITGLILLAASFVLAYPLK